MHYTLSHTHTHANTNTRVHARTHATTVRAPLVAVQCLLLSAAHVQSRATKGCPLAIPF